MAFGAALFASQLCAVLFATSVWGWSVLEAGLAAIPGPIASAVAAPIGGRWASRSGPRPVAIAGAGLFALSLLWVVVAAGSEPDFFGVWLPYGIVGGAGIGLGLPALIGATATGLPPARFATGMALATTAGSSAPCSGSRCSSRWSALRRRTTRSRRTTPGSRYARARWVWRQCVRGC